jgi:hypothetical protein
MTKRGTERRLRDENQISFLGIHIMQSICPGQASKLQKRETAWALLKPRDVVAHCHHPRRQSSLVFTKIAFLSHFAG